MSMLTPTHEASVAVQRLLDKRAEAQARTTTMLKIADFATFFGTVLRNNQGACLARPVYPRPPQEKTYPKLALPAIEVGGRYLSLLDTPTRTVMSRVIARQVELVLYPEGPPEDYWKNEGIVLADLRPTISIGNDVQHNLLTPPNKVDDLETLNNLELLTNAVLAAHNIPPYPGYSE